MTLNRLTIAVCLATILQTAIAASIQPDLVLSNFHSSAVLNIIAPYSTFGGFDFNQNPATNVFWDYSGPAGELQAWVVIDSNAMVDSGPTAQSISATASADFAFTPGWMVTRILVLGYASSGGALASASFGMSSPCAAAVYSGCVVPGGGANAGTFSMDLHMTADMRSPSGFGEVAIESAPRLLLTVVPTPEPGTWLMFGAGLVGIMAGFGSHRKNGRKPV